jgi:hypothetical protein
LPSESLCFRFRIQRGAAKFLWNAQGADADLIGDFQYPARQPLFRFHIPFGLPVLAREWNDVLVSELPGDIPHHAGFLGQSAFVREHLRNPL